MHVIFRAIIQSMPENVLPGMVNAFLYAFNRYLPHYAINWFLNNLTPVAGATDSQRLLRALDLIEMFRERYFRLSNAPTPPPSVSGASKRPAPPDDPDNPQRKDKGIGKRSKK